jgi:TPP-dependent pyruvate/acetoin dehydrogenase alpha subunit
VDSSASLYRTVRLIRRFEQRAIELVRAGHIVGGTHPYIGQEGVAAGVCAALRAGDMLTSTHRGHGHVLARGADPARLLAELCGRVTGLNAGRGGSMHAADLSLGILGANGIVGAGAPMAVGAAWAARQAGTDAVAVAFFGDGALNQGVLLESINLAALRSLPVVFVCENNGYAISLAVNDGVAGTVTGRATAFGVPARTVDGSDPVVVHDAARDAVARARAGGGPSFLECVAYRFDAHHTWEHKARPRYRSDDEVAAARLRDPVDIQGARLDAVARDGIDVEIEALLDDAVRFALDGAEPDPADALQFLYADPILTRSGVG